MVSHVGKPVKGAHPQTLATPPHDPDPSGAASTRKSRIFRGPGGQSGKLSGRSVLQGRSVRSSRDRMPALVAGGVPAPHVPFHAPTIDDFGVEAPISPDPEARQFTASEQLVDGGWVNTQVLGQFLHGHDPGQAVLSISSHLLSNRGWSDPHRQGAAIYSPPLPCSNHPRFFAHLDYS